MKKIIKIIMLLLSYNLQPSSIIRQSLQYVPLEQKAAIRQSVPSAQPAYLESLTQQYWHYLKTGQGKFIDLINAETKEKGIKELGLIPADIEKMELYCRNFLMVNPIEEFAHTRLPNWMAEIYDNVTDEIALDWENFMELEAPGRLGLPNIRKGLVDHILYISNKKYHFIKKEFKNNQHYKRSTGYKNIEIDFIDASKKYKTIQDVVADHYNIEDDVEYIIVPAAQLRNFQIIESLKRLLDPEKGGKPQLKILIVFDDQDTNIPSHFSVQEFIEHLVIAGRNITHIEHNFLFNCKNLKDVDLNSLTHIRLVGDSFLTNCNEITQIDLKCLHHITQIKNNFLSGCGGLIQIDLRPLSQIIQIGHSFLSGCSSLTHIDLRPLSQITHIEFNFLLNCRSLKYIDLSPLSRVTHIKGAFLVNCSSLAKLDLRPFSHIIKTGTHFLAGCSSLTHIDLNPLSNTLEIENGFLYECSGLTAIDLSPLSRVKAIGDSFLEKCKNLVQVDLRPLSLVKQIGDFFLFDCEHLTKIFITRKMSVMQSVQQFMQMHPNVEIEIQEGRTSTAARS
ncbi:MAG TPA: leucine-rich repeat protein [Candidatus Saccharimonadales bacterium]|nr:leucine-rich repeat protein [Candidatus Saccharimonadales bacterium]